MASSASVVDMCNPLDHANWDQSLLSLAGASIFHTRAWAHVLQSTYGYKPLYLAETNHGQEMRSLLPLMEVNSWLTGRRGVSLPFADHCAVLSLETRQAPALIEKAIQIGKARRWKYIELRGVPSWRPDAKPSIVYYGHHLDLTVGENRLLAGMESATRRAVRKAEKSGVTVQFDSSLAALRDYYGLHCRTRKKHGLPPQPWAFFRSIHAHILKKNLGTVALAKHEGRPVAGAVFFHFGDQVLFKFGAADERKQHLRGNNQVMSESIKLFARKGFACMSFGRTSNYHHGLRRFKRGFGAAEFPIDYYKFDLKKNLFAIEYDTPISWYNRVFKSLPVFCSRAIGFLFYKHLA